MCGMVFNGVVLSFRKVGVFSWVIGVMWFVKLYFI